MYGIFTYIWVIYRANVSKYSIHGSSGICGNSWKTNVDDGVRWTPRWTPEVAEIPCISYIFRAKMALKWTDPNKSWTKPKFIKHTVATQRSISRHLVLVQFHQPDLFDSSRKRGAPVSLSPGTWRHVVRLLGKSVTELWNPSTFAVSEHTLRPRQWKWRVLSMGEPWTCHKTSQSPPSWLVSTSRKCPWTWFYLVGGLEHAFFPGECHHPNWRTHTFSEG